MSELPFRVILNLYVPGKGYALSVQTDHVEMPVYVSEKGRVIQAYEPRNRTRDRTPAENRGDDSAA